MNYSQVPGCWISASATNFYVIQAIVCGPKDPFFIGSILAPGHQTFLVSCVFTHNCMLLGSIQLFLYNQPLRVRHPCHPKKYISYLASSHRRTTILGQMVATGTGIIGYVRVNIIQMPDPFTTI